MCSFPLWYKSIVRGSYLQKNYYSTMSKVFLLLCFLPGLLLVQAHKHHKKIGFYELKRGDLRLNLTNYGATIISVITPDKHGLFSSSSHSKLFICHTITCNIFVVTFFIGNLGDIVLGYGPLILIRYDSSILIQLANWKRKTYKNKIKASLLFCPFFPCPLSLVQSYGLFIYSVYSVFFISYSVYSVWSIE